MIESILVFLCIMSFLEGVAILILAMSNKCLARDVESIYNLLYADEEEEKIPSLAYSNQTMI